MTWLKTALLFASLVPDDQETMSEMAYPSRRPRFLQPARSSSRAMMPLHRLNTLKEVPSVDVLNESRVEERGGGRGGWAAPHMSRKKSSSSDSRIPAPRRQLNTSVDDDSGSADNFRYGHHEAETGQEEEQQQQMQPSSPPPVWAAEPRDNAAQNPLLRRPQWNSRKK